MRLFIQLFSHRLPIGVLKNPQIKKPNFANKYLFNTASSSVQRTQIAVPKLKLFNGSQILSKPFSTEKLIETSVNSVSVVPIKKRKVKKKKIVDDKVGFCNITAFSTAEEYDLENVLRDLNRNQAYDARHLSNDFGSGVDAVYAVPTAKGQFWEIFFFREGSVIFWNTPELEITDILNLIKRHEDCSYQENKVKVESEIMNYTFSHDTEKTIFQGDDIVFGTNATLQMEKYTISNAISASTTLGIWESSLEDYVITMEDVIDDLKQGNKIKMSREEVLKKTGQLFSLRHSVNLGSDLLDTPDFYWDREDLEMLYLQTFKYFCVSKRTKVINEKINHCLELVELLSSHLNDNHHVRLEWMIIVLIMVEVIFEFLHIYGI